MSFLQCRAVFPKWKIFLRGVEETSVSSELESQAIRSISVNGDEAHSTYEDIVGHKAFISEKSLRPHCKSSPSKTISKSTHKQLPTCLNAVMRRIESKDIDGVCEAIQSDPSLISAVDSYGWSLLMCAACAGAEEIVKILLDAGAETHFRDKRGDSCVSIARRNGYSKIVALLTTARCSSFNVAPESTSEQQKPSIASCDKCKKSLPTSDMQKHLTSTVHLLNCNLTPSRTYYSISERNRGYQLMLKSGWNRDRGLGLHEDGRKLPLKTVLKNDRRGVGAAQQSPRVTHFSAFDKKAVSVTPHYVQRMKLRHSYRQQHNKDIQREKWRERNFRREFY